MLKKLIIAAIAGMAASAYAASNDVIVKSVELKNGSTVHVFQDGAMAMESRLGQVVRMQEGQAMEAKDGRKLIMVGDEVARLYSAMRADYRSGQ